MNRILYFITALMMVRFCLVASPEQVRVPSQTAQMENPVLTGICISPDNMYEVRLDGLNTNVTAGGVYPAEKIQVVEVDSGKIVWENMGYYAHTVLWSPDSRYAAISCTARTYTETIILDTESFSTVEVPLPEELLPAEAADVLAYVSIYPVKWEENNQLQLSLNLDLIEFRNSFTFSCDTAFDA